MVVGFAQGAAVGAMIRGIPVANGQYAGSPFGWLHPFAILTGIGLVLGYALLGAGWLVLKSEANCATRAHHRIRWLTLSVFGVLFVAFTATFRLQRSGAQQFARQALGPRISGDRVVGVGWDPVGSAQGPRSTAVRHDVCVFSRRLPEPGA